jgi:hypothetical protein
MHVSLLSELEYGLEYTARMFGLCGLWCVHDYNAIYMYVVREDQDGIDTLCSRKEAGQVDRSFHTAHSRYPKAMHAMSHAVRLRDAYQRRGVPSNQPCFGQVCTRFQLKSTPVHAPGGRGGS